MEPSEEIRRVVHRWMTAISEGDSVSALGRLSEQPGALTIGTDVAEWWRGEETRLIWGRQIEELGGFPVLWDEIEAWEEGTVGWASVQFDDHLGRADLRRTRDLRFPPRARRVEGRADSLVASHGERGLGMALTRTLEELERTVQREQPDLSATLAADGTVTIVFTDIVDSTVLISRVGDHAWLDVLRRHNTVIEDATAAHGGTVVETQGDGSMLAFSSARRAVACAQAIQCGMDSAFADGLTANSRPDRRPHRRRAARGGPLLRHHRALRGARRQPGARRRGARVQPRARARVRLGHRVPRESRRGAEGDRGFAPALRSRPHLSAARRGLRCLGAAAQSHAC